MKHLILIVPLALTACAPGPKQCGLNELIVIGQAKDGGPIYDDQAPLLPPCIDPALATNASEVITKRPSKTKLNAGRGNGSEGSPDQDPGNSGNHNQGGD